MRISLRKVIGLVTLTGMVLGAGYAGFLLTWGSANQDQAFGFSLLLILRRADWPVFSVYVTETILGCFALSVVLERFIVFSEVAWQTRMVGPVLQKTLAESDCQRVFALALRYPKSHVAYMVALGLEKYGLCEQQGWSREMMLETVSDTITRAKRNFLSRLRKGLRPLATVVSTAPVVGMFGTVVSILKIVPYSLAAGGCMPFLRIDLLQESIVTTLFGLSVGIPALWMFHHFKRRIETFELEMEVLEADFLRYIRKQSLADESRSIDLCGLNHPSS